jgi:hypothetical protein
LSSLRSSLSNTQKTVKDVRRNTRPKFSSEVKIAKKLMEQAIRTVLDGSRDEIERDHESLDNVTSADVYRGRRN